MWGTTLSSVLRLLLTIIVLFSLARGYEDMRPIHQQLKLASSYCSWYFSSLVNYVLVLFAHPITVDI